MVMPNIEQIGTYVKAVPFDQYGPTYVTTFTGVVVSAAQDSFELNIGSTVKAARLREVRLSQYSDAGDAAAEMISVQIIKGYTVSGSGGTSVTPVPFDPRAPAATSTVKVNNTTLADTGTPLTMHSEAFNVAGGFLYQPGPSDRPKLIALDRIVVRISAPVDALTMNGTMIFEERV